MTGFFVNVLARLALATGATLIGWTRAATGAVKRFLNDKLNDHYNVMDWVPIGTDTETENCSPYVQAAINYLESLGGGVLDHPPKRFKLLETIVHKNAVTIKGSGMDATVYDYHGTSDAVQIMGTAGNIKVKANIRDMSIHGTINGISGLVLSYASYGAFHNVRIRSFETGILGERGNENLFTQVFTDENRQDGWNLGKDANDYTMVGCQGLGNTRAGLYNFGGRSVRWIGGALEANGYGAFITSTATARPKGTVISGAYIEGNQVYEVLQEKGAGGGAPRGTVLRDNLFTFINTKAATALRIEDADGLSIDGNTFDDEGGAYNYSIYINNAGNVDGVAVGINTDKSTNKELGLKPYFNQKRLSAQAWASFSVSAGVVTLEASFGIVSVTYVSVGVYEVTWQMGAPAYKVGATCENGAAYSVMVCSPGRPISNTVFRLYCAPVSGVLADARTVNFDVFA